MSEDAMLKVGDVVVLKGGGHLMTITSIDENTVTCDWSVRGDIKSKSFPDVALTTDLPASVTIEDILKVADARRAGPE